MTPSIILRYFDIPGRAEIVRLLLHYAGIPFTDRRIPHKLFPYVKSHLDLPFGSLPTLEVDGQTFGQTLAIARYAATLAKLYPTDDFALACQVDSVAEKINDMMVAIFCVIYMFDKSPTAVSRKKIISIRRMVYANLKRMEAAANSASTSSEASFFGERTWIDLYLFDLVVNVLLRFYDKLKISFDRYPKLRAIVFSIAAAPELASYFLCSTILCQKRNPLFPHYSDQTHMIG
ncbi:unnamed protein product [Aphanomyces euteiches]|nr:hypothetical protein Ae201684P_014158 [Aphanomyces euteiches]